MCIEQTMHAIASHFNQLNNNGRVKGMSNERGYAKIYDLVRTRSGCSLFVRHELNDRLNLSLLITHAARRDLNDKCSRAVELLRRNFSEQVQSETWISRRGSDEEREHYFIDVTARTTEDIIKLAELMRDVYGKNKL